MKLDYIDITNFNMIVDGTDLLGWALPSRILSLLTVSSDCSIPYIMFKPPEEMADGVRTAYKEILDRHYSLAEISDDDYVLEREFGFYVIAKGEGFLLLRDAETPGSYSMYMAAVPDNVDIAAKCAYIISDVLGFSSLLSFEVRLSVYELLNNSVEHGLEVDSSQWVQVDISRVGSKLLVSIVDKGVEFDPTKKIDFDIKKHIDSGSHRGLGLVLTSKIADSFHYARENGSNRIFFEKSMFKAGDIFDRNNSKEEKMAQFEYDEPEKLHDGSYVFRLKGDLDTKGSLVMEDLMDYILDEHLNKVVLDFENVPFVSSAGVGIVLALVSSLREQGGEVIFQNLSPKVKAVFRLLNLDDYFVIRDSEDVPLR